MRGKLNKIWLETSSGAIIVVFHPKIVVWNAVGMALLLIVLAISISPKQVRNRLRPIKIMCDLHISSHIMEEISFYISEFEEMTLSFSVCLK